MASPLVGPGDIHVLVVDSDEDTREVLTELVSSCDRPVHATHDTEAAAAWLKAGHTLCALVISCGPRDCDQVREFVKSLRRLPQGERARIVVLSTLSVLEPFDAGTVVLRKPFDGDRLIDLVCGHC